MSQNYSPKWKAYWIWGGISPVQPDTYMYFRKQFDLKDSSVRAYCCVTADTEYKIFLNGRMIGHGPVMTEPRWKSYDVYDIRENLNPGENIICAIVYHYGNGLDGHEALTAYDSQGGFLCQIDCFDDRENLVSVISNASWIYNEYTAWNKSDRKFDRTSYCEDYNANKEPLGWMERDFDSRQWRSALEISSTKGFNNAVLPSYKHLPWLKLEPRSIPYLEYKDEYPKDIINIGETIEMGIADPDVEMAVQHILPSKYTSIVNEACLKWPDGEACIVYPMDHNINYDEFSGVYNSTITLDFGKLLNGRIHFEIEAREAVNIDIGYGQRLINGKVMPYFSTAVIHVDHYTAKKGRQCFETFNWRSFRYVQLNFRNMTRPLYIYMMKAVSVNYPYTEMGCFECSDEMLNWIWKACCETVKLCTYDRFMDNPDRERREYTGDISNMTYAVHACFGDSEIIYKYLDDVKKGQPSYGLLPWAVLGLRPEFNRTLTDGNSFVVRILDFYKFSGNKKILEDMFEPALASVKNLEEHINEAGLLEEIPYSIWVDWAEVETKGIPLVINVTFAQAMRAVSEMARVLGENDISEEYRQKSDKLADHINDLFWDDNKGIYTDAIIGGVKSGHVSEQCNFLMMLYGFAERDRIPRIIKYLNEPGVEIGQIEALQFYPVEALFKVGEGTRAIELMKKRYGRIRKQGFDTVSEVWSVNGIRSSGRWKCPYLRSVSQCGGTIAAYFLSRYVPGIFPLDPGFSRVLISPALCGLEWAKGKWHSPMGLISVEWSNTAEKFSMKCSLPEGVTGEIQLPFDNNEIKKLFVNRDEISLSESVKERIIVNNKIVITVLH